MQSSCSDVWDRIIYRAERTSSMYIGERNTHAQEWQEGFPTCHKCGTWTTNFTKQSEANKLCIPVGSLVMCVLYEQYYLSA
jgi:hypothetical protein